MFIKLIEAAIPTDAPDRHERKSLICNQPNRSSIEFLIDTAAIRNGHNPCNNNDIIFSNKIIYLTKVRP
jgi:hypothetical protein